MFLLHSYIINSYNINLLFLYLKLINSMPFQFPFVRCTFYRCNFIVIIFFIIIIFITRASLLCFLSTNSAYVDYTKYRATRSRMKVECIGYSLYCWVEPATHHRCCLSHTWQMRVLVNKRGQNDNQKKTIKNKLRYEK